jgi:DNA-binding HxlR family transcriptional regulator
MNADMRKATGSAGGEPLYDPKYPARQVLRVIADTWTPIVLFCLNGRTRRFNELQRSIPDISKKMLTQTLRRLERRALVNRLVHPVVPPHVDYSPTPIGAKFAEAVALLCNWAEKNKVMLKRVDRTLNRANLSSNYKFGWLQGIAK